MKWWPTTNWVFHGAKSENSSDTPSASPFPLVPVTTTKKNGSVPGTLKFKSTQNTKNGSNLAFPPVLLADFKNVLYSGKGVFSSNFYSLFSVRSLFTAVVEKEHDKDHLR